ncbi:hypothetical protein BH23VER1_BH23VER1_12400 [soil metagenome]
MALAETQWEAGRFLDSWATLEALEPIERATPDVSDLRCRICIALERWELGTELAAVLAFAVDVGHHVTAAEFYVAHARERASWDDVDGVRELVGRAVSCCRPIRLQILNDHDLMRLY